MTSVRRGRDGAGSSLSADGSVAAALDARRERALQGVLDAVQFPAHAAALSG